MEPLIISIDTDKYLTESNTFHDETLNKLRREGNFLIKGTSETPTANTDCVQRFLSDQASYYLLNTVLEVLAGHSGKKKKQRASRLEKKQNYLYVQMT